MYCLICSEHHIGERESVQLTQILWVWWHESKSGWKYHQRRVSVCEGEHFLTVCAMHFGADMVNHSWGPPLCLRGKKPDFIRWIINDHSSGKNSTASSWPKTNHLWVQPPRSTCTHPMFSLRCEAELLFVFEAERPFGLNYEVSLVFFLKVK